MSDNAIAGTLEAGAELAKVPQVQVVDLSGTAPGTDGPLYLVAANGERGLETRVVDVRGDAPEAFAPRGVPTRIVTDQESFASELARRPLVDGRSTVWANRNAGTVTAVYDDLGPAGDLFTDRNDRLELRFVRDADWKLFLATADGQHHSQEEFGNLLESAGHLITSHAAADLLELVDSIRATSSGSFESRIQRSTGGQTLSFSEEVEARAGRNGQLEVPRTVTFLVSPFEDYPPVEVTCWLRLRISGGKLSLGLFPQPYDHVVRASWFDVVASISVAIAYPILSANL
ncbi:hypothetical protein SEA_AYOTOYA_50 [Gordonia phage Ayotoya]|uniref:DUF2303 family protein n=5 Tax=Betterkatzvirus betterkatz TaxID=2560485 RepID=A0A2Z5HEX9_9CAUD|nr:hypothetical protein SEA_NADEEM_50 [Gordonia phage Nadeem]AZS11217.1 hypothetical protein PBI_WHEATTHIN_49 [Gordonia phage WheatThin]QAU06847.1 hypothetical protein SEA_BRYLIE_50 [Gordonia phage Brylie]QAX92545.1 hypothetical protein SEA_MULCH_50 [Gordonia phage Mulch]QAY06506.1 hypothetical protein SEA_PARADA_50 [Gordonia phage Parada]QSL99913.1 hypothetical protein SEA_AYOTOYA_50 [Gordonia phage Ayotoya]URP21277.1 hypothetical protein SEA_CHOP_50 [Gordonia phage Chop]UXL91325.1 hypothet